MGWREWLGFPAVGLAHPSASCDHRYCYRDTHCTLCGKLYSGTGEPNFTPHIIVNDKPVPAVTVNGVLVPEDATSKFGVNAEPCRCTYCGGTKFHKGPSGGVSTNILCANPDCRHWFNYHQGILPMDDLHRVEPSEAEKKTERNTKDDEALAGRIREGYKTSGEDKWLKCPGEIAERVEPIHRASRKLVHEAIERVGHIDALHIFARFCVFLDGYDGHPVDAFKAWMEKEGKPLSSQDLAFFEREYHKEE